MNLNELRLDNNAPWKQRFRIPTIASAQVARSNPAKGLVASNTSGQYQLYAWNILSGALRQLTYSSGGTLFGTISPDGNYVYYLADEKGDEIGHFVRVLWEGGEAEDITPEMRPYSGFGLNFSRAGNLLGSIISDDSGFHAILFELANGGTVGLRREFYHSTKLIFGPSLSYAGELAVITSTERTRFQHYGLVAFEKSTGKIVSELWEKGSSLFATGFSPLPGDFRLLATSSSSGYSRPFFWDPVKDERVDLGLTSLSGDISPLEWSADAGRILLLQTHQATQRLITYEMASGKETRLNHRRGVYSYSWPFLGITSFSGSKILTLWQDSTHPPQLVALNSHTGRKIRTLIPLGSVPAGRSWRNVSFKSSDGETVQGWLGLPKGRGPFPTILYTHGGPETQTVEYFMPGCQAWLDHGFAWLAINYRGSTGFGSPFREKIWGDIGHWEVEDIVAARKWLIEKSVADAGQILLHGWSYGGYLTLLALGKYPDIWAGGMAGTATVDWAMEFEDLSDPMKGYSVAIFGGTPAEKPEQYAASSPMTYLERVKAPVLIIQGRRDTRTPPRPVEVYEDRMKALSKKIEVHWYEEGHAGGGTEEEIQHQEIMLRFAYKVLG